jgi:hypothetical protein
VYRGRGSFPRNCIMNQDRLSIITAPFRRNKAGLDVVLNPKGQAVIEYILLLVISISIILGAFYQFSDAFRNFSAKLFGNYLECLIDSGELPGSGGPCSAEYKPFDISKGSPLVPPGSGGPGGSSGGKPGGTSGGSSGGSSGNSDGGKYGSGRNGSNGGRNNSSTVSSGRSGLSEKSASSSIPAGTSDGGQGAGYGGVNRSSDFKGLNSKSGKRGETVAISDEEKSESEKSSKGYRSYNTSATGASTSARDQFLGRLRYIPTDKESQPLTEKDAKIIVTENDKQTGGRKVPLAERNRKPAQTLDSDTGFSLPNFIRYLLIAAIFIIIVFFIGGQAFAFKKGQEKS